MDNITPEKFAELREKYSISNYEEDEAIEAYIEAIGEDYLSDFEESYNGKHGSDEDFAQQLCEDCGDIPKDLPVYIYIDWERTAHDVMMDYTEQDGYYFRNM